MYDISVTCTGIKANHIRDLPVIGLQVRDLPVYDLFSVHKHQSLYDLSEPFLDDQFLDGIFLLAFLFQHAIQVTMLVVVHDDANIHGRILKQIHVQNS